MAIRRTSARILTAISAFAILSVGAAAAQQADDTIVVTGQRAPEMAQAYAGAVALAPAAADQYARWNIRLCPSVAGLSPADAQTLIDHIARRAHQVGLQTERAGCQPNLVIVFSPDSDTFTRQVVAQRRDLLGYYTQDDVVTAGREGLDDFANTPRPVRWWHISRATDSDGRQLGDTQTRTGHGTLDALAASQGNGAAASTTGNGFEGLEAVRSSGTRIHRNTRQDLSFALVIVDTSRIAGATPQAVADYLAMATLVQLDPKADMTPFPTILNLFATPDGQAPPAAMTDWDMAYLQGLYSARRDAANARAQRSDIANRIVRQMQPQ